MKILFLDWNSYGNEDMIEAFEDLGFSVSRLSFDKSIPRRDPESEATLSRSIEEASPDFVFSFNYFPIVSTVCEGLNIKYISFVYDSPHVSLYSCTVINKCNRIFLFDSFEYKKFATAGINTMYYLPLCANPKRISKLISDNKTTFSSDVTFVGALYTEKERYIKELITSPDGIETKEWLYEEYIKNRILTGSERVNIINRAAEVPDINVTLFTHGNRDIIGKPCSFEVLNKSTRDIITIPGIDEGVKLMPPCHPYSEAPIVYNHSKVNLCVTLKSIHAGIPLRTFEIMASKGLLLMNKQEDMDLFFTPGEDYFVYEDPADFDKKLKLLLSRDFKSVVENAFEKIKEAHTFKHRAEEMVSYL